ncbi:DUF3606 domain-containing protein [Mesorhizobium sp. M4B.F.Ca.ET.089.01.1.1]|uniref:DUF3606 domain-containing protein n=1 Tax=Mesorhizobium sp. M4B.F.Ca.ET.089.01.1.1 TaxID=2496662 RepID=UPI000FE3CE0E|nr:DUF3606 domain-containing protein [Mesorhizobium sp. M4B.F.Ca.ET.089.01.1.1]RWX69632.1 DUF3606 domain-containing protein [Mesorhizobium sp. M4B.F.Ca.ET.089.01.1.1]
MIEHQNEHHPHGRKPVTNEDACEVAHFARNFHLTIPEARMLIRQHGDDPSRLEREARKLGYQQ